MSYLKNIAALVALVAGTAWAYERITVFPGDSVNFHIGQAGEKYTVVRILGDGRYEIRRNGTGPIVVAHPDMMYKTR